MVRLDQRLPDAEIGDQHGKHGGTDHHDHALTRLQLGVGANGARLYLFDFGIHDVDRPTRIWTPSAPEVAVSTLHCAPSGSATPCLERSRSQRLVAKPKRK